MRIPFKITVPLLRTRSYKLLFGFAKRFSTKETIVSLGCNCHPAHMLESMNFRKQSLPFDWLLTNGDRGMEYVCDNIKNDFRYYTQDLKKDENGNVYAGRYNYSVFFHYPTVLTDNKLLETLHRRTERFRNLVKSTSCVFLYCAPAAAFTTPESVQKLKDSIDEFMTIIKPTDKLLVYITCDESLDENKLYCDQLMTELKQISRVSCARFLLEVKKYGLWGYENNYSSLFKELGLKIHSDFPALSLIKEPATKV